MQGWVSREQERSAGTGAGEVERANIFSKEFAFVLKAIRSASYMKIALSDFEDIIFILF